MHEGEHTLKKKDDQKVPFYKLFSFADRLDVLLIIVGSISAVGNGLAQPIMTLIFGQLINSFAGTDQKHVVHEVSKVLFLLRQYCGWVLLYLFDLFSLEWYDKFNYE